MAKVKVKLNGKEVKANVASLTKGGDYQRKKDLLLLAKLKVKLAQVKAELAKAEALYK